MKITPIKAYQTFGIALAEKDYKKNNEKEPKTAVFDNTENLAYMTLGELGIKTAIRTSEDEPIVQYVPHTEGGIYKMVTYPKTIIKGGEYTRSVTEMYEDDEKGELKERYVEEEGYAKDGVTKINIKKRYDLKHSKYNVTITKTSPNGEKTINSYTKLNDDEIEIKEKTTDAEGKIVKESFVTKRG